MRPKFTYSICGLILALTLGSRSVLSLTASSSGDIRFQFTEKERQAVKALQITCDQEGIKYKHIFELAKYVLSAQQEEEEDPNKILSTGLNRLKKRNQWRIEKGIDNNNNNNNVLIDPYQALLEMEQECPEYFVNDYTTDNDGRIVVAHHHAFVPTQFVKTNLAKYLAAEQFRFDLAAANMEEARNGIAMVSITDGQLTTRRAYRYLKLVASAQDNLKDMHPHRIQRIYSQVPSVLAYLVGPAKKLLPSRIAQKIQVVGSMDELHKHIHQQKHQHEKSTITVGDWARERMDKYEETISNLSLD